REARSLTRLRRIPEGRLSSEGECPKPRREAVWNRRRPDKISGSSTSTRRLHPYGCREVKRTCQLEESSAPCLYRMCFCHQRSPRDRNPEERPQKFHSQTRFDGWSRRPLARNKRCLDPDWLRL